MQNITIDHNTFLAGISRMDGVEDGGYSPLHGGHNIQQERDGYLYPQPNYSMTVWGGAAVDDILDGNTASPALYVKSPEYQNSLNSVFGVLVDTENNPYGHDSINRFSDEGGLSTSNVTFRDLGEESGVAFQGDIYLMADDNIVLTTLTTSGGYDSSDSNWWSSARGHSTLEGEKCNAIVVEDTAYFIEKNKIHTWDGTTSVEDAMTLPPDFYATAALKHPNGRDLIVFGAVKDRADKVAGTGFRAYYINLVDLEFTDEIPLEVEIHGVWNVAGTIYVTSYEWLGIFDGNGVRNVYKLDIPGLAGENSPADDLREYLIRTHHATVTDQGYLLIPDGAKVLAIGDLGQGTVMWHIADLSDDMAMVHMVFNIGNKYVGVFGYTSTRWTDADLVATRLEIDEHDGAAKWASNKYRFNQRAWVRKIMVDHETLESGDDLRIGYIKEDGTEQELRAITFAKYGAKNQTRIDCNVYTDVYQLYAQWVAGGVGIKKITIFYENGE